MEKVLLINWDNYPNTASGGVYAWAKLLVEKLNDFEFVVLNFLSNPNVNSVYKLPANVSRVIEIPLYGSLRPEEFYGSGRTDQSLTTFISKSRSTNDWAIEKKFNPVFENLFEQLTSNYADSRAISDLLVELNSFFATHDVKTCMENATTFDAFLKVLRKDTLNDCIRVKEALDLYSFLQRILLVISIQLPRVDLIHASNAWFPALAGVSLKRSGGIPMIVTEHGVAFKDLLLHHRLSGHSQSYDSLWKVILTNIVRTIYDNSDLMAPVCEANTGIPTLLQTATKTRICYNGVDMQKFRPMEVKENSKADNRPTVVFVGRIELLKDVLNLIQAISHVKEQLQNVVCKIYGSSTDPSYAKECLNLVEELSLQENVIFVGNTSSPELAYNSGDVVVLSSVREGFPYTLIEAMSCGKAVIATNVGGVSEALANCGFLVKSRRPLELSKAILRALTDPNLRSELGYKAIRTVEQKFTIERSVSECREIYNEMLNQSTTLYRRITCGAIGGRD